MTLCPEKKEALPRNMILPKKKKITHAIQKMQFES
jgi:hypothetical protein